MKLPRKYDLRYRVYRDVTKKQGALVLPPGQWALLEAERTSDETLRQVAVRLKHKREMK